MELQAAFWAFDNRSEYQSQQNAQRMFGKAVDAVAFANAVDKVAAATDAATMLAEDPAIKGKHPAVEPERDMATCFTAVYGGIKESLEDTPVHSYETAAA
jgi:hypothetical protein